MELQYTSHAPEEQPSQACTYGRGVEQEVQFTRFVAYGVVAPVVVAGGIMGNFLTILLLSQPQFKGVTYLYFRVLAVSDLVGLGFCISLLVHLVHEKTLVYSTAVWYAYLENFITNVPFSTSVMIIVCVTVDRFYSICRPTQFGTVHTKPFAWKVIMCSLAFAVIVWLPVCFLKKPIRCEECCSPVCEPPDNRTWWVACADYDSFPEYQYHVYSWVRQCFFTFIPIIVVVVLNVLTIKGFQDLSARRDRLARGCGNLPVTNTSGERRHRKEQHLIGLLLAVVITFVITMLPCGVLNSIHTEKPHNRLQYEIFRAIANDLEILSHALNFYMYILCSRPIRVALRAMLGRNRRVAHGAILNTFDNLHVHKTECTVKSISCYT